MIQPRFVDSDGYQTKLVIPDLSWCIYGHPTNFNYFVKTALSPAAEEAREVKVTSRKAHVRRRYAKDPNPINVQEHVMDYIYDPGRKVGRAIPGWSFILDDGIERRQFTTTGDVQNLVLYLQDEVNNPTRLYTQGASTLIKPAASEGA